MSEKSMAEVRKILQDAGLGEVDDLTIARLARGIESARTPEERLQAVFTGLGLGTVDPEALKSLAELAAQAESGEELADAIFIGPCPSCDFEGTKSCENEPGIEDPTVGQCPKCGALWCSECGTALTREKHECANPDCWLNQEDEEELEEPEL